jgi:hypothetical protein
VATRTPDDIAVIENRCMKTVDDLLSTEPASIVRVPVPDLCALWAETATAPMNIALIGAVERTPLMGPDGAVAL